MNIVNRTKNYTILFLVVLAVYQTGRLWFGDFSSHNFFYYMSSISQDKIEPDTDLRMASGFLVHLGNKRFVNMPDNSEKRYRETIYDCITMVIGSGEAGEIKYADYNELIKNKSVIVEFTFPMSMEQKTGLLRAKYRRNTEGIVFDSVIIIPEQNLQDIVKAYFVDNEAERAYEFTLRNKIADDIQEILLDASLGDMNLYYESSVLNGFFVFKNNVFLNKWTGDAYRYNVLLKENPYTENGDILLNHIERHVDVFFDNPSANWASKVNEIYTYSDENTVVKYYPGGVLEYSNYKPDSALKKAYLYDSYEMALYFLKKDETIQNEYYLKRYKTDGDEDIFYFDYKIDNIPIEMSDGLKKDLDMQSFIEVTVSNGAVSKYKRYIYNFKYSDEEQFLGTNYLTAIDKIAAHDTEPEAGWIKDLRLLFNVDEPDSLCSLKWYIETIDNKFLTDAE